MSHRTEVRQHMLKVAQYERNKNVAGLLQELTSEVQGTTKYGIPRADAALALGRLRALAAVPQLRQLASDDPEMMVRVCAIEALSVMRAKEAEATIVACLDDSHRTLRVAAAEGLGRIGARDAIPRLRELLDSDPDAEVRLAAVDALVVLGDKESRGRVPDALKGVSWLRRRHRRSKELRKAVETGEPLAPYVRPWD